MSSLVERSAAELRALHARLLEVRAAVPQEARLDGLIDLLERDLLPRTAGGHDHLVAGIVGPNNAGKSALFNALVAASDGAVAPVLSPSLPTGGATRRLVGAVAPALREILAKEESLRRFPMRVVDPGPSGAMVATETPEADEVAEILLVETASLPDSLLLVDTPDFDSVAVENRLVTDALLAVADLAIVVVTRHTYQNHDVIEFLRGWLGEGRPWVLVYNESIDEATTLAHAQKIESDLDGRAEAIFAAPFDVLVARGEAALVPKALRDAEGAALGVWLRDLGEAGDLKERALDASRARLRAGLGALAVDARGQLAGLERVDGIVMGHAERCARAVAREAMPMGPFLEAFREVLDERPTLLQKELRRGLRWTGTQVAGGARWISDRVRGGASTESASPEDARAQSLASAEGAELTKRWSGFVEPLFRELREVQRADDTAPEVSAALGSVTGSGGTQESLGRVVEALELDPDLVQEYRAACREIISAELDRSGSEWALQLAVDALHLLPIGVAGAMIVHTGGMGADLAVAGGGALSAAAAERLSRTLGTGVALAARQRWVDLRTPKIAAAVSGALLGGAEFASARAQAEMLKDLG